MTDQPPLAVSFVIPILNEVRHVRAAVESVLAQDGLDEREVLLVCGNSTDGTDRIVAELAERHPEVRVLRNPLNAISRSMNIGAAEAKHPVVVRVDAHSVLPERYAARAAEALRRVGAVNLGGRMHAQGTTRFEDAVAWSYNSRVGLGGAIYHVGGEAGPAESAYLGVFDREKLLEVGGFDETLSRGEDWELNLRLRDAGGLVWFEPDLEVVYRPRSSLRALAKQFYASGRWRGELIRRLGQRIPFRYYLPPVLVISLLTGALVALASLGLALTVSPAWWWGVGLGLAPTATYLVGITVLALGLRREPLAMRLRLVTVLPTMHVCWGWGCLLGLFLRNRGPNSFAGR